MDWRALLADTSHPRPRRRPLRRVADHLRDPRTPGNRVEEGATPLSVRFRESATRLERFYRLCAMSRGIAERFEDLESWRRDIAFFVEVRAWMVKLDAADREASGKPVSAEVNLYLSRLAASVVDADEITDLYAEAGIGHLDITQLNEETLRRLQGSETPRPAAEALRRLIQQKMREVTRRNVVRRESFAERLEDLMIRYTKAQLSNAEVISADARRGERFDPPLSPAELAFYDALAHQGMARALMGDDILAKIARPSSRTSRQPGRRLAVPRAGPRQAAQSGTAACWRCSGTRRTPNARRSSSSSSRWRPSPPTGRRVLRNRR